MPDSTPPPAAAGAIQADIAAECEAAADGWFRCPSGPTGWLCHPEILRKAATEMRRLTTECDRLRAVVERLPKTRDGVAVLPGDTVFAFYANNLPGHKVRPYEVEMGLWPGGDNIRSCYSTREAAAALSPGGAGEGGGHGA